ncbi:MAG: hypothetical protein KTR21_08690 [Rhodobacteraceae bacterium]|nr:hypothetical protein [Paracoccaceae bacterium]
MPAHPKGFTTALRRTHVSPHVKYCTRNNSNDATMPDAPFPTLVAYSIGYYENIDLIPWAAATVSRQDQAPYPSLIALMRLNPKQPGQADQAGELFKTYIQQACPPLSLTTPEGEYFANQYFRKRLQQFLDHQCTPWQVCRMVSPIEQIYDFPPWLGGMYDACDWVGPSWTDPDRWWGKEEVSLTLQLPPVARE